MVNLCYPVIKHGVLEAMDYWNQWFCSVETFIQKPGIFQPCDWWNRRVIPWPHGPMAPWPHGTSHRLPHWRLASRRPSARPSTPAETPAWGKAPRKWDWPTRGYWKWSIYSWFMLIYHYSPVEDGDLAMLVYQREYNFDVQRIYEWISEIMWDLLYSLDL